MLYLRASMHGSIIFTLTTDMAYFSKHYRPCKTTASGWCNIPNKARFNPTE